MPEGTQVQAPETQRPRPSTSDPAWILLFDRLDAQDEDMRQLTVHVNHDVEELQRVLATKVGHGEVLRDLWLQFRASRPAQAVVAAVVTAMAPVVAFNWGALVENLRSVF